MKQFTRNLRGCQGSGNWDVRRNMSGLDYFETTENNDDERLKSLCLQLVKCEKEIDVISILKRYELWNGKSTWKDYGDKESNFSVIGNQQASADRALVEKITNSIDAMLLRECRRNNIDPESYEAPESIKDALNQFFKFKNGSMHTLRKKQRDELSNNIQVITTGRKPKPSVTVIDLGEGQSPRSMPSTFLSLLGSNKLKIQFVQGSYNQGSTGALKFCGKDNLQLILSKRMPEIKDPHDETADYWGFTLIRRFPATDRMRNVIYRYLVIDHKIPMFKADKLFIRPRHGTRQAYGEPMEWGSFVKMYDYNLPSGIKASSYKLLKQRLDVLMPEIALPVSVWERRDYEGDVVNYPGHVYGLNVKLDEVKNKLETGFPSNVYVNVEGKKLTGTIYAFKDKKEKRYYSEEAIIYSLNGQSHGFAPRTFMKRSKVALSHISDLVLIIVDCGSLSRDQQTQLFMTSRDRLANVSLKFELEMKLEAELKQHQGLKQLNFRKRSERAKEMVEDNVILKETIQDIVNQSMYLDILKHGKLIHSPVHIGEGETVEIFEGKQFPSYFRLKRRFPKNKPKIARLGSTMKVEYETDVDNHYFERVDLPGAITLMWGDETTTIVPEDMYKLTLWNGIATLSISIQEDYEIGTELYFNSEITDEQMIQPIKEEFYALVEEKIIHTPGGNGERKPKKPGDDPTKNSADKLDLPNFHSIFQKDWEEHSFDKMSSAYIMNSGELGYDVYINMDNVFFRGELTKVNKAEKELYENLYQTTISLFAVGMINEIERRKKVEGEDEIDLGEESRWIAKSFAPLILPLIRKIITLSGDFH